MAETLTSGYRRAFEVRLLHHYWLDEGGKVFDRIAAQAVKDARLLKYDRRPFLGVRPTVTTEKILAANHLLFKETALGFVIAAPASAKIPGDTVLQFIVTVEDSRFHEYTALTLRRQTIHELYNELDKTTYRYKENVPVLSNLTGTTRGIGAAKELFLSQGYPAQPADDLVESLALSGSALVQLTSDGPGAATQQLGAQVTDLPSYLHQGDVPSIMPPTGLIGAPARGVSLTADVEDDVYALLSLASVRANDAAFSFVDAQGMLKPDPPVYQVRFKNRSTFWRYVNKATGAVVSTEASPLPLTYFGNAGTKQKPSNGQVRADTAGARITRLVSEIYA